MGESTLIELPRPAESTHNPGSLARRLVHAQLSRLRQGRLLLRDPQGTAAFGDHDAPAITVDICDPAFYAELAYGGSVGAGESYMLGQWRTDDLTRLLRLMLRNRAVMDGMEVGLAQLSAPLRRVAHWMHRNSRAGSRRNIAAHYDLGNDFFRLFLDESMTYSCALFEPVDLTLAEAQTAKLDAICQKLALRPDDHLLEIGTGWGGLALHAARHYGCRVTTTTISPRQHQQATERIRTAGLAHRITVLLQDYRDLEGRYDKLVSVEMIEAIGHRQFEKFFRQCGTLLNPRGRMLLQSITIADRHFERARDEVDFIKRHIFPGSCIPSVGSLTAAAAASGTLQLTDLEDIGPHYATTLAHWRYNFLSRLDAVRSLGFDERFIRMWEFYFCYCEAGFAEDALGDVHMVFARSAD